ncbi:MAG: sel1 repeat family protein, partial [Proteobacteria bacterium]|nr:sel1 repeat family protein [Pseudomonadota bacterium]
KAGHLEAQYALGSLFQKGWKGIPPNHREAANWFKQAAERGHVKAQWQLSLLYENGRGIKKSIVEAYRWSTIAIHAAGRDSDLWRNGSPRIYRLRWQIPGNQFPRVEKSVMAQQAEMARAQANGQNGQNGLNGQNGQNGLAKP